MKTFRLNVRNGMFDSGMNGFNFDYCVPRVRKITELRRRTIAFFLKRRTMRDALSDFSEFFHYVDLATRRVVELCASFASAIASRRAFDGA